MDNIAEITASLVETYIVVRFCNRFLGFRNQKMAAVKSVAFFLVLAFEDLLANQTEWGSRTVFLESVSFLFFIALITAYAFLFLNGRVYEKTFPAIFIAIAIPSVNLTILNSIRALSGESGVADIIEFGGKARMPALIFSKLAFFLLCEFVLHMKKRKQYAVSLFQWAVYLSGFLITFLMACLQLVISVKKDMMQTELLMSVLIIMLNVLLYILLEQMKRDSMIKEEYRISKISIAAQERFVDEARKQYMEMKTLRHDMRHYLTAAVELLRADRAEDAKAYIEKVIDEKVDRASYGIDTGNVVVDAVVNSRIAVCLENHIEIKCMIDSNFQGVNDIDMSVLLSNVLDNAISGCADAEVPQVSLTIGVRKAFTYIIVENSIRESVLAKNPMLETDKEDKAAHGFGIMSIRKIADKYKGSVEWKENKQFFIVEIWLENNLPFML